MNAIAVVQERNNVSAAGAYERESQAHRWSLLSMSGSGHYSGVCRHGVDTNQSERENFPVDEHIIPPLPTHLTDLYERATENKTFEEKQVIAYGSHALSKAERNYCVTDRELLAVKFFIEHYRQYLLGRRFLVRTDHQALRWLFSLREPKARIARWIEILSAFNFEVEYRPGKKHGNADALSRCPQPQDCHCSTSAPTLQCGPCNKCEKRSIDMQSRFTEGSTSEVVRRVKIESSDETTWGFRPTVIFVLLYLTILPILSLVVFYYNS